MKRQRATTSIAHNDGFSKQLIESTVKFMGESGIPTLADNPYAAKKAEDDFSKKDPKEKASPADPMGGVKQSVGAQIQYTNVVTKESCGPEHGEKKETKKCKECGKSPCKCEKEMKESFNLMVDDVHYVFEKKNAEGKEQGADGKACWKGYKYAGTKNGKDKCVKEDIGTIELDEKAPPGDKYERMVKHIKKGYSKGGVSEKEKSIAYATAWKSKNKATKEEFEVEEVITEKMDPVGKEDKDIDNDGDHDKSDKYLHGRRKKIGKILSANKKMKEEADLLEKKN